MNSLERMIGILELFEGRSLSWTFEEMHERLGYSRATLYRYLKVLADADLLTSWHTVGYTLGPRITELDYRIRTTDPLIVAGRPVMQKLVGKVPGIALLCRRYRGKVLCVHQENSTKSIHSAYERGRARPLLRGAASRIILAYLPTSQLIRLFRDQKDQFKSDGLGSRWPEIRTRLREIRKSGWDVTTGQVTPGVTGIAAPLFDKTETIIGSLSITVASQPSAKRIEDIAREVVLCAKRVTKSVSESPN